MSASSIATPTGLASGLGGQGLREVIAIIAVAVTVIGGGEFLLRFFEMPQYVLPTPSAIGSVFASAEMPTILQHYGYTLVELFAGYAIGTVTDGEERPIIHSDRGAHYRWPGWLNRISNAQLVRSMSRKGCSQDNAACEGFFGRLKTELFYPRDWKTITIEQFVAELDAYIRWYNEKRIKISLGSLSPVEYRQSLGLSL